MEKASSHSHLLEDGDGGESYEFDDSVIHASSKSICSECRSPRKRSLATRLLLALSLVCNALLLYRVLGVPATPLPHTQFGRKSFISSSFWIADLLASLAFDQPTPFVETTEYSSTNLTEASVLWENLDYDSGVIALPISYAQEKGLPQSQAFPWDQSKAWFLINAYHSIHCLA